MPRPKFLKSHTTILPHSKPRQAAMFDYKPANSIPRSSRLDRCAMLVLAATLILSAERCLLTAAGPIPYDSSTLGGYYPPMMMPQMMMPMYALMNGAGGNMQGSDPYGSVMNTAAQPAAAMSNPMQYYWMPPMMPPMGAGGAGGIPPADTSRRSNPSSPRNEKSRKRKPDNLNDLPSDLAEPDNPASFTERLSDSFSALGEGVRNHFRSIHENFSDTIDDIKDAWRPTERG